jgi:hypothetical protein
MGGRRHGSGRARVRGPSVEYDAVSSLKRLDVSKALP